MGAFEGKDVQMIIKRFGWAVNKFGFVVQTLCLAQDKVSM
jgi:hypothetical protein